MAPRLFLIGASLAGAAARAQESAPRLDPGAQLVQVLGGLALVLALVGGLAWAVRRFGQGRLLGGGDLRLVGGLSLGARERLVVVQVGRTQLVLGVAPGRVQTLHVLDTPLEPADAPSEEPFAVRLGKALSDTRHGGKDEA